METGKCGQLFTAQKTKHIFTWSVQITDTATDFPEPVNVFMAILAMPVRNSDAKNIAMNMANVNQ